MHGFPPQVSSRKQSYRVLIVKSALRQLAGLQNEKFDELEMCELQMSELETSTRYLDIIHRRYRLKFLGE